MFYFFFFNDTATTEIYTLSLHDALPIFGLLIGQHFQSPSREYAKNRLRRQTRVIFSCLPRACGWRQTGEKDRKSTRLNSSHGYISYAVFCLKKKNNI